MLATRIVYFSVVSIGTVMNGAALLDTAGWLGGPAALLPATLLFNLLVPPLALWAAYRSGEFAEREHRRKSAVAASVAATARAKARPRG